MVLVFLVHDSDIAAYWLYQQGRLVDEFNSNPDYFDERIDEARRARLRGEVEALLPLCVAGTTRAQLEAVLHPEDGHPLMAEETIIELAPLLGIDKERISLGFRYFEAEGAEILPDVAEFEPLGRGAQRKAPRSRAADTETTASKVHPLAMAVGMLSQVWNVRQQLKTQFGAALALVAGQEDAIVKKLVAQFDRAARDLLKDSNEGDAFEALKAARDQGPEPLALWVATHFPEHLTEIGVGAAVTGGEDFVAALLKHGLDPNTASPSGLSALQAAERHGSDSDVYRLLKAASDQRRSGG